MEHSDWWLENEKRNNMPFSHIVYADDKQTIEVGAFDENGRVLWFDPRAVKAFDRLVFANQIMRQFSRRSGIGFNPIADILGEHEWLKLSQD